MLSLLILIAGVNEAISECIKNKDQDLCIKTACTLCSTNANPALKPHAVAYGQQKRINKYMHRES